MQIKTSNIETKTGTGIKSTHQFYIPFSNNKMQKKSALATKKYHFIGIGGVGTSALAMIMSKNGAKISGSDMQSSLLTERLNESKIDVKIGHSSENLPADIDGVIISAAVKENNPELIAAKEKKIMIYKYAQMLGLVMDRYRGVAIAGTHGKSTTSGWLVYTLSQMSIQPNFVIGADINQLGTSSGLSSNDIFVAEACEYDRSFLSLHPKIGVILNIESDHLDYYSGIDEITDAFNRFAGNITSGGVLIAPLQDAAVAQIIADTAKSKTVITFGIGNTADFAAQNIAYAVDGTEFDFYCKGSFVSRVKLQLAGEHNVKNALVVLACIDALGADAAEAAKHIGEFTGMDRRLMLKAEINGITVLDDYAHHPTEIKASLKALRQRYGNRKIFCIFQPHQYSRTRFLLKDFAESFKLANETVLPEIYFVRDTEQSKQQVNSQMLAEEINFSGSRAVFIESFESICEHLKVNVKSGDIVITMGAGTIWKVADEYIQWLRDNR